MARKAREKSISGIYHILLRGINRQCIFEDDEDRRKFLNVLNKYKDISQCKILAYCLMDNHIHLLVQESQQESVGMFFQRVSSSYVLWFNNKHDRCGHLFQERFKSEPVDTDSYFLTVLRYILQNPLKAKFASDTAEYRWSSYHEYISSSQLIDRYYVLHMFSDNLDEAVERFLKFSKETINDACLDVIEDRRSITDHDLQHMIRCRFNINAINICKEEREKQTEVLRALKEIDGTTIRQISRITSLPVTRIWKA